MATQNDPRQHNNSKKTIIYKTNKELECYGWLVYSLISTSTVVEFFSLKINIQVLTVVKLILFKVIKLYNLLFYFGWSCLSFIYYEFFSVYYFLSFPSSASNKTRLYFFLLDVIWLWGWIVISLEV